MPISAFVQLRRLLTLVSYRPMLAVVLRSQIRFLASLI